MVGDYCLPGSTDLAVTFNAVSDSRSWYGSAAYRISKRLEVGSYFSWFIANWPVDKSLPTNHVYDRAVTARVDLTSHWFMKLEGHFMDGYGAFDWIKVLGSKIQTGCCRPRMPWSPGPD